MAQWFTIPLRFFFMCVLLGSEHLGPKSFLADPGRSEGQSKIRKC